MIEQRFHHAHLFLQNIKTILQTFACIIIDSEASKCSSFTRGKRNKCAVTRADTGFPGRHRINFFLPKIVHVANVVGFPGFIFTRPKKKTYFDFI